MKHRRSFQQTSKKSAFASLPSQLNKHYDTYQKILKEGMPRLSGTALKKRIQTIERLISISEYCYPEVLIACERLAHLRRVREFHEKIRDLEKKIRSNTNIIQTLFSKTGGWTEEDLRSKRKLEADLAAENAIEYRAPTRNDLINSHGEPLINSHYLTSIIEGLTKYLQCLKDALALEAEREKVRKALVAARIEAKAEEDRKRRAKREAVTAIAARSKEISRMHARTVRRKIQPDQIDILQVCPYCASALDQERSHADHIYPIALGGLSTISNMVLVCDTCNLSKRDLTLREFIARNTHLNSESIIERLTLLGKKF